MGVLFGALAVTTAGLLVAGPRPAGLAAPRCSGRCSPSPRFGAVPLHGRLSRPSTRRRTAGCCAGTPCAWLIALAQAALGVTAVLTA